MIQQKGAVGPLVYTLQEQLNERLPATDTRNALKLTGKFDADTEKRVREFQLMRDLTVTGIVDDVTSAVLMQITFEYERVPRPIVILQSRTRYHCWAAALSSWTQAIPQIKTISVWEALNDFKKVPGALDEDNEGMTTRGWSAVVRRWRMAFKAYGGGKGADIDDFTVDKIWRQVKARGPLLIAYNLPDTDGEVAHTIVTYGVHLGFGSENQNFNGQRVWCMNPWVTGREMMLLRDIREAGQVLVMWK